jgi:hypothetical protein
MLSMLPQQGHRIDVLVALNVFNVGHIARHCSLNTAKPTGESTMTSTMTYRIATVGSAPEVYIQGTLNQGSKTSVVSAVLDSGSPVNLLLATFCNVIVQPSSVNCLLQMQKKFQSLAKFEFVLLLKAFMLLLTFWLRMLLTNFYWVLVSVG